MQIAVTEKRDNTADGQHACLPFHIASYCWFSRV